MIWLVLALIGAGSFFVTGFNLLTDPLCVSADFGGGRVVQVTCRSDEFGTVTGLQAGLISILIGLGILSLLFWRPIKALFVRNKLLKEANNKMSEDNHTLELGTLQSNFTINSSGVSTKRCPKCAEDIKVEAIKCRFCGSNLSPKGVEKTNLILGNFLKKYPPKNHVFEIMALTLVLVASVIFISIQTTKSRELNALNETGQICVYNEDSSINFGCASYPTLKFEVCSKHLYIDWRARLPEWEFISGDYDRSIGKMGQCSSRNPYLYSFDYRLQDSLRLGEYEILGFPYQSFSATESIEGEIIDLIARVSLK